MCEFKQDADVTPVIFRKWNNGQIIALFPCEPGTYCSDTCGSYEHIGQHGSATPDSVMLMTRPAKPEEYTALKRELESAPFGYRFKVCARMSRSFLEARKTALAAMR